MPESTLSLKKSDLQQRAAGYLGWGTDSAAWDDDQKFYLADFLNSACRRVYQAAVQGKTYDWSWLRPTATLTLAEGATEISLPDDFGGLEGSLVLAPTSGTYLQPIRLGNIQQVRDGLAQQVDSTGPPQLAAVDWVKGTGISTGQRAKVVVCPTADREYTLKANYYILPDALSDTFPYAPGGANLAEVYLEGILAVAEQRLDDVPEDSPAAVHQKSFARLLAAAIDQDRRNKPQTLGRNRDLSDEMDVYRSGRWHNQANPVEFNGVVYGPSGV